MRQAIADHAELSEEAYGIDLVKPTHHFIMHLPDQIEADGLCIDDFVHERKHRAIKRVANRQSYIEGL